MLASLIISCLYAGKQVPVRYKNNVDEEALEYDEGALDIAVLLSESLGVACYAHQTSRSLIDVDLPLYHKNLFGNSVLSFSDEEKQDILDKYYFSYRIRVEKAIAFSEKPALHLSVRSFSYNDSTKVQPDFVIYYNESRNIEKEIAQHLEKTLHSLNKKINLISDKRENFGAYLRTQFNEEEFAHLELYVNKQLIFSDEIEPLLNNIQKAILELAS